MDAALSRLLRELGLDENDLFRTRDEVVLEAYGRRGQQIAYTLRVVGEETAGRPEG